MLGGCMAMAESYSEMAMGSGDGYTPPAADEPSATVVIYTPADTTGIQGRTIFNIPVGGRPMRVDYYLSRNPIRSSDRPAVPWRGLGDSPEVRVHVHRPLYVGVRATFDGWDCNNDVSFQPAAGQRYRVTQIYSGMTCGVEVVDLASTKPVEITRTPSHN